MESPGRTNEVADVAADARLGRFVVVCKAAAAASPRDAVEVVDTASGMAVRGELKACLEAILGAESHAPPGAGPDGGVDVLVTGQHGRFLDGLLGSAGGLEDCGWPHYLTPHLAGVPVAHRADLALRRLSVAEGSDSPWLNHGGHQGHGVPLIVFIGGSLGHEIGLGRHIADDITSPPVRVWGPTSGGPRHSAAVDGGGKRRADTSDEGRVAQDLQRARGRRELAEIESRRAIWSGYEAGLSQRKVGDLIGRSQPDVGRTIKKVEQDPSLLDPTPREFALRRLVGECTDQQMMDGLLTFEYTVGESEPSPVGSGFIPGTWDQVRALRREGLITEPEWDELFRATFGESAVPPQLTLPASADQ